MPHHRGPHPEDPLLFTEATRQTLLLALEEATYLLDRGYTPDAVLDVVGRRHELRVRQRTVLQRSLCSTPQRLSRGHTRVTAEALRGAAVEIDGFNQIIPLEVASAGGLLVRGADGAYRDLAGLRGSYHPVAETEQALALMGAGLADLAVAHARFFLDQPVSNSGRLKQLILEQARSWACEVQVELVRDPDKELYGRSLVISSDAAVLDRVASWFNLTGYLLAHRMGPAWVMDLAGQD